MNRPDPDKGTRVRLIATSDPYTNLRSGDEGTVSFVDSLGTVHVAWDNGSTLGLVPGEDAWENVDRGAIAAAAHTKARRELNNLASFVRRSDLTGWVKDRNAEWPYERALRAVVAVEDVDGIEAAAKLSDRLTALRIEATEVGLLTPEMILRADARALE